MNFNINKPFMLALALPLAAAAAGPSSQEGRVDRARWVMGTLCEIDARGANDAAVSAAFAEIERWDRILSLYKEESELSALNRAAGKGAVRVSPELLETVTLGLAKAEATGGAYDPTVLPVLRTGPEALPLVGWRKVRVDRRAGTVELPEPGMGLDFGGLGKGLALDKAAAVLKARGARAALLNFGGQVLAVGAPDGADGWEVRVPGLAAPLRLKDASVAVSGDSERPGHIVSPFDGRRARRTGTAAAIMPTAAEADGWSTALYLLWKAPPGFTGRAVFDPGHAPSKGDKAT